MVHITFQLLHPTDFNYQRAITPKDRANAIKQVFNNPNVLSIYCDTSVVYGQPIAGLSALYVGCGYSMIKSKKINTAYMNKTAYLELKAVRFSIENLDKVVGQYNDLSCNPTMVIIYSDMVHVEKFIYSDIASKAYMREIVFEIKELLEQLPSNLTVEVKYLGNRNVHRIFHQAAHFSARTVIVKDK